jgi:hypothetical protein
VVLVQAVPEALMLVRASSPLELVRLAWHIGNRHLTAEIHEDHVLLRRDGVIFDMLVGLGADVSMVDAPFTPKAAPMPGMKGTTIITIIATITGMGITIMLTEGAAPPAGVDIALAADRRLYL